MLLFAVYCIVVFGDQQGVHRPVVPNVFLNTPLTHVRTLTALSKPWATDKFTATLRGQNVFIKTSGVRAEHAYYQVGMQMGFEAVLLPSKFDMTRLLMVTPALHVTSCAADVRCRDNCANPSWGVRHAMIAALDYVMGYIDRPMNCHFVRGKVFAIDNDSMDAKHANNDYQWQYVPDRAPLGSLCNVLPTMRPIYLQLDGVNVDNVLARHEKLLRVCA